MRSLKFFIGLVLLIVGFTGTFFLVKVSAQSYRYCTNCGCPGDAYQCINDDGETSNTCTNWSTCDRFPDATCCQTNPNCSNTCGQNSRYYCTAPYPNGSCSNPGSPSNPGNPGNPPAPGCTQVPPGSATLLTPATESVMPTNSVTVTWAPTTSWGEGCPNNLYQIVFISPDCSGSYTAISGVIGSSVNSFTFNNLDWGRRYCWTVGEHNNGQAAYVGDFTFYINATPTLVSSGFTNPDTCDADANGTPNGVSGRFGQPNATNPVTYSVTFRDNESDSFEEIWLAFVPNVVNAQIVDRATVEAYAGGSGSIGLRLHRTGAVNVLQANGASGAWTGLPANNQPNSATVLNATFSRNGAFATGTFTIRFNDNFPYGTYGGNYNIYAAALMVNSDGTAVTSYASAYQNFNYYRAGSWRVDVNPPSVYVGTPTVQGNGSYDVLWAAGDVEAPGNAITQVWSYIFADQAGSSLRDNTIGATINPPNSQLDYPTASNAGVTLANLVNHNYTNLTPALNATSTFRLVGQDFACNISRSTSSLASPIPWLITYQNSISAGGGYNGFGIPNLTNYTVPYTSDTGLPYLSTYSVFSGNANIVNGGVSGVSKANQVALTYQNLASSPPLGSGTTSWYQYLLSLVTQNARTSIATSNATGINGNASTSLGIAANTKRIVTIERDNFIVESNSNCDVQAMIFVSGNIIIRPDFNFSGNNRCMFIAGGNITIENGSNKTTPAVATSSTTLAQYDIVRSLLIASNQFTTTADQVNGNGNKWDGLYIQGSVISNLVDLRRSINLGANAIQPAHVFVYDPAFIDIFGTDLSRRDFSIREVGK